MPKYTYPLSNGKSLVLEGDSQPSDQEVEQLAKQQGVALVGADEQPGMLSRVAHGAMGMARGAVDFAKNHPAEIGAVLGGIAAVPLTGGASLIPAVAAAGLGGAGGAGLGMIGGALAGSPNIPSTAGGVVKKMATEGASQAAGELVGQGVSKALAKGASRVYQGVLKPSLAARIENPELVETGLKYALPVSKGGTEKAGGLMKASKDTATQMVKDVAAAPGARMVDPKQVVSGITPAVKQARKLQVAKPTMESIGNHARNFLAEHPRPMALPEAHEMVRATDEMFNPEYRRLLDQGDPLKTGTAAATVGINDATRGVLRDAVPGLQEQNAKTSALESIRQAIDRRAGGQDNRSPIGMQHLINAGIAAGTGGVQGAHGGLESGAKGGLGTFLALEALTHPASASRLAILASKAPTAVSTAGSKATVSPLIEELLKRLAYQAPPDEQ